LGVQEIVVGDLRDKGILTAAVKGARTVYHICPNIHPDELSIGRAVISAAQAANVQRFIFHSVLHPHIEAMPHHWNKLLVEEALLESDIPYTILQPSNYMQNILGGLEPGDYLQNLLGGWQSIVEHGLYAVPYGVTSGTKTNMVDLEDVAEASAIVACEPSHMSATYELAGPDLLTQIEIAETLSSKLKRPVRAEQIPIEIWRRDAARAGMETYKIETLVKMFQYYDRCDFLGNSRVLANLLARTPTKFAEFVERTAPDLGARCR